MIRKIEFEYLRWKAANNGRDSRSFSVVCLAEEIIVEYSQLWNIGHLDIQ